VLDFAMAGSPAEPTRTGVIGLGICDELDAFLDGGTANGELAMYVAPAGVGKTSYLWASTAYAASKGRNVLGITLEINARKCVQRVDQWLTKLDKYTLIANPFIAIKKREELQGKVYIKDWTAAAPTVDDIRALVLQMRQKGQPVDYLMIDYMELIRPDHFNINQVRHGYSQIAKSLRSLAKELDVVVLTAWQTNRAGADKHVLSKTDVGEDWGVIKIADIAIGLNQNAEELRDKQMRVNILKQRESTARNLVTLKCDLDRMIIHRIDLQVDLEPLEVCGETEEDVAGS
jgi:replicative DNA helicase